MKYLTSNILFLLVLLTPSALAQVPQIDAEQVPRDGVTQYETDLTITASQIPDLQTFLNSEGFLQEEVDGSILNEIQTLSIVGNTLSLSLGGGSATLPTSGGGGGGLTAPEVVAIVESEGYIKGLTAGEVPFTPSGSIITNGSVKGALDQLEGAIVVPEVTQAELDQAVSDLQQAITNSETTQGLLIDANTALAHDPVVQDQRLDAIESSLTSIAALDFSLLHDPVPQDTQLTDHETRIVSLEQAPAGSSIVVSDTAHIDLDLTSDTLTANIVDGSVGGVKLTSTVNDAVALAQTSIQPGSNISELTNDSGYLDSITSGEVPYTPNESTLVTCNQVKCAIDELDAKIENIDVSAGASIPVSSTTAATTQGYGVLSVTVDNIADTTTLTVPEGSFISGTARVYEGNLGLRVVVFTEDPSNGIIILPFATNEILTVDYETSN